MLRGGTGAPKGSLSAGGRLCPVPVHPTPYPTSFALRYLVSGKQALLKCQKQFLKESDLMGVNLKTSGPHSGFSV